MKEILKKFYSNKRKNYKYFFHYNIIMNEGLITEFFAKLGKIEGVERELKIGVVQ